MFMKKNQVIVFILALLLVTVGYLGIGKDAVNETVEINANQIAEKDENETLGDATFVNAPALVPNETENTLNTSSSVQSKTEKDDYFASSKLQRETMYSQNLESYQKMIDSTEISAEQKAIAQNEIIKINNEKNAIMIIENLIITKGFENVIVLINGKNVNVVVKTEKLDTEDVAKIQNIVSRELEVDIENIHISSK